MAIGIGDKLHIANRVVMVVEVSSRTADIFPVRNNVTNHTWSKGINRLSAESRPITRFISLHDGINSIEKVNRSIVIIRFHYTFSQRAIDIVYRRRRICPLD